MDDFGGSLLGFVLGVAICALYYLRTIHKRLDELSEKCERLTAPSNNIVIDIDNDLTDPPPT